MYGLDVTLEKEECVNHIAKHIGTALRKLATEGKKTGVVHGGRGYGKLTQATITKLTAYHGKAIRSHLSKLVTYFHAVWGATSHPLPRGGRQLVFLPEGAGQRRGAWQSSQQCGHAVVTGSGQPHQRHLPAPGSLRLTELVPQS